MFTDILLATGIVAAIGLICGGVIAVASKVMQVKVDEKVKQLRDCLPGANCGACGYTGCDSYAKALANGAKTNLCVPGSDTVSRKISEILGVEFEDVVEKVAFVGCNGHCNATKDKQIYEGMQSCAAANLIYGGTGACTFGCLGYGDCAKACPNGAICVESNVARIDTHKCVGCGVCAKACPNHLIILIPDVRRTVVMCSNKEKGAVARKKCSNACIACKKCENTCPNDAIHVIDNRAVIDFEKCVDCGKCAEVCPVGVIRKQDLSSEHQFTGSADASATAESTSANV